MTRPLLIKYGMMFLVAAILLPAQSSYVLWKPDRIHYRQTNISDIVTPIFNNGSGGQDVGYYAEERIHFYKTNSYVNTYAGRLWFGCMKDERKLISGNGMTYQHNPYGSNYPFYFKNSFVPGVIDDPKAGMDTAFSGVGWKYNDDPNYIVYVSTDYDSKGVDISGNNFPDWPVRMVNGTERYVNNVLERSKYPPIYKSGQDIFTVYKDTDTRLDSEYRDPYADPDTFSIPIGIEVHQYCYSWSSDNGILKNSLIIKYEIINKSGFNLTQCYAGSTSYSSVFSNARGIGNQRVSRGYYAGEPLRNMIIKFNPDTSYGNVPFNIIGQTVLQSPLDPTGEPLGLTFYKQTPRLEPYSAKRRYEQIGQPPMILPYYTGHWFSGIIIGESGDSIYEAIYGTGPFDVASGDTARFTTVLMVGEGMDNLLLLDDMVKKVYENDFPLPLPPTAPTATVTPIEGGTRITWDSLAESSIDPLVPDTLGKPFFGYRLYRAQKKEGPYQLIKEWKTGRDSIVHEYTDKGTNGLLNNISYYYKLTSFDEGSLLLDLPPMESGSLVNGVVLQAGPSSPYDLANIRIVPNPFVVTHAAQLSIDRPAVFFNYLPDECTIRIYTTALELVAELHHSGGSRAEWNLRTQGGQQVASQLLIAKISTPQGTSIIKKFAVVFAE